MKDIGTIRKIDELGRIVIPKEYLKYLSVDTNTYVELVLTDDRILMKKASDLCAFCGEKGSLIRFENGNICKKCVAQLQKLSDE